MEERLPGKCIDYMKSQPYTFKNSQYYRRDNKSNLMNLILKPILSDKNDFEKSRNEYEKLSNVTRNATRTTENP